MPFSVARAIVPNVAALAGFALSDGDAVEALGGVAAGDGGGQPLVYRATGRSGITVNDGTLFAASGADDYFEATDKSLVSAKRFGLIEGLSAAAQTTALQNFLTYLGSSAEGSCGIIPPGNYSISSQCTLTAPIFGPVVIFAYGAEITTSGAISGLAITGGAVIGGASIFGLKINHRGNADATAGFDIYGAWYANLRDCIVEAHGVGANYGAFVIRNSDPADNDTGSFWTTLDNCRVRKRSGSDVGDISNGVILRGSANATTIRGGALGNCTVCVRHAVESGQTYLANALLVDGVAFEGYGTGYLMVGAATSNYAGFRCVNSRFENGTTVFSLTGVTTQPSVPPIFAHNFFVSNAGTYLSNANSLFVQQMDMSMTPLLTQAYKTDVVIDATSGSTHPMTLKPSGGGRGLRVMGTGGTSAAAQLVWTGTSNNAQLLANTGGTANLQIRGVKGLSGSGASVDANNLRGSVSFASGDTTKAVAFGTAEPDATYFVALGADTNKNFWVTSKATGGFTINKESSGEASVVDWILIR